MLAILLRIVGILDLIATVVAIGDGPEGLSVFVLATAGVSVCLVLFALAKCVDAATFYMRRNE